jgi:glucose/arabinose dehydrogenase
VASRERLAIYALAAATAASVIPAPSGCGSAPETTAPSPREQRPSLAPEPRSSQPARASGRPRVETVASGLDTPWEIAFLPDGQALITERPGRLRLLSRKGKLVRKPLGEIEVAAIGEGGLMGLAVDPDFSRNRYVYLYRTTRDEVEVLRYRFDGRHLRDGTKILGGIAVGARHVSGRLRFGPDGWLYLNTGDATQSRLAQDPRSLNGKTLRLGPSAYRGRGGRAEVFTLGHRNGQGIDWQPSSGRLFEIEHGPIGNDEINILVKGRNYGWPIAQGRVQGGRFTRPLVLFEETLAPSGASFVTTPGSAWTGDLLIAALRGEQLRRIELEGTRVVTNEGLYVGRFGRLRTVREGPDGALYLLTSNREPGRGATPAPADDRVLRIVPPAG